MRSIEGSCLCRGVRYEIRGPMRDIVACHCNECRKMSGHYTAATAVRPEHLHIVEDSTLRWYRSSERAKRAFCQRCGATLFWKPDSGDRISVYAGSIDAQLDLQLAAHIFVNEKGAYYEIQEPDRVGIFPSSGASLAVP